MIIDEHRHVGYCGSNGTRTAGEIIAEMDRLGVDRAVVAPGGMTDEGPMSQEEDVARQRVLMEAVRRCIEGGRVMREVEERRRRRIDHDDVLEAVDAYGERLLGCWWVNPWRGEEDLEKARAGVRERGLRYWKVHPMCHVFAADDEVMDPVMACAGEADVPVWFHSSYGPGTEVGRIANLARRFPETQVILGHAGVTDLEGRASSAQAAAAAGELANVWIDLSDCRMESMQRMIEDGPADRLMLASDDPFGSLERQMGQVRRIVGSDKASLEKIMGENAARLLKI